MPLPFISRFAHEAITLANKAGADATHAALERENSALRQQLAFSEEARQQLLRQVMQMAAEMRKATEATVPQPRQRRVMDEEDIPEPDTLDLSQVDENNNEQLTYILRKEMPSFSKVSGVQVQQSIERLRMRVRMAKASKIANLRANPVKEIVQDMVMDATPQRVDAYLDKIVNDARDQAFSEVKGA